MTGGRAKFDTLRNLFRAAGCRQFRATSRANRSVQILGFGPDSATMIGWWEGADAISYFSPDERNWTDLVVYL